MTRLTGPVIALGLILLSAAAGCSHGRVQGTLRAESLGDDPVYLAERYPISVFAESESTETLIYLADMPLDDLLTGRVTNGVVVHLDLLWNPKAGQTPMDPAATNISIRYIVFAEGEVGVYGGAGFARPRGKIDGDKLTLVLKDASLTLLDSTDGFVDMLSPARLTGSLTARLDDQRTRQIGFALSQMVTNALGRTRLVSLPSSSWSSTWSSLGAEPCASTRSVR